MSSATRGRRSPLRCRPASSSIGTRRGDGYLVARLPSRPRRASAPAKIADRASTLLGPAPAGAAVLVQSAPAAGSSFGAARDPDAAQSVPGTGVILILHNRYRAAGGEERAVADLAALLRRRGHAVEVMERSSQNLGPAPAAAGLLAGGIDSGAVASAVRRSSGARGPRPQHPPDVRLEGAGRRRCRRRTHRAAPPQLSPVLRDRDRVSRRGAVLSLPARPLAARRAAPLSRLGARGRGLRGRAGPPTGPGCSSMSTGSWRSAPPWPRICATGGRRPG